MKFDVRVFSYSLHDGSRKSSGEISLFCAVRVFSVSAVEAPGQRCQSRDGPHVCRRFNIIRSLLTLSCTYLNKKCSDLFNWVNGVWWMWLYRPGSVWFVGMLRRIQPYWLASSVSRRSADRYCAGRQEGTQTAVHFYWWKRCRSQPRVRRVHHHGTYGSVCVWT